jgi:hypothetical protein
MGKTPRVVSGQPSAHSSLPHAWARYFVVGHRHANLFDPYDIGCAPKEVVAIWREVLALLVRRYR